VQRIVALITVRANRHTIMGMRVQIQTGALFLHGSSHILRLVLKFSMCVKDRANL